MREKARIQSAISVVLKHDMKLLFCFLAPIYGIVSPDVIVQAGACGSPVEISSFAGSSGLRIHLLQLLPAD
jgi:hypothetical protein